MEQVIVRCNSALYQKGIHMTYLTNHQVFASRDLGETQDMLSNLNAIHKLEVLGRRASVDTAIHAACFSNLNLLYASFGDVRVKIETPECDTNSLFLVVVTNGGGTVRHQGQDFDVSQDRGMIRDMRTPLSATEDHFSALGIELPLNLLRQQAHALIGDAALMVDLKFKTGIDLKKPGGRHIHNTLNYIARTIDEPLPNLDNTFLFDSLRDLMLVNVLMQLPNSFSDLLQHQTVSGAIPYYVKRARDYVHEHADSSITLQKLVSHAGCSYRTMQVGFNEAYGMSPMAYLKSVRLARAHLDLMNAGPDGTVSEIAAKWGFIHMGRFSHAYAKRFSVLPSETLRRSL